MVLDLNKVLRKFALGAPSMSDKGTLGKNIFLDLGCDGSSVEVSRSNGL